MSVLGRFRKAFSIVTRPRSTQLQAIDSSGGGRGLGGWWRIWESYAGAWQQNVVLDRDSVLAQSTVFACITLIASDMSKLRPKLVQLTADDIWVEIQSPAFSPFLTKPNNYQNRIQFQEWWALSKLIHGNTYALKARDDRSVVIAEFLLDPTRVTPLVSESGDVFYRLQVDQLSGITREVTVPASEIIHDRYNCLFHPLMGVPPLFAGALAATQALRIQGSSNAFFGNRAVPGGILTAPGPITDEAAIEMKKRWEENYGSANLGKIAVLGDGLKFEPMAVPAQQSQLIEQLRWTAETVCSCFHIPPFKVGIGPMPTYQNAEVLNQIYYTDCLQKYLEDYELCQDEGLGLTEIVGKTYGVELDVDQLLRMDSQTQVKTLTDGIGGALFTPNEARKKIDKKPLVGGDTVYMQQQQFSLAALNQRDQNDPFAKPPAPAPAPPASQSGDGQQQPPAMTNAERELLHRTVTTELVRRLHAQPA